MPQSSRLRWAVGGSAHSPRPASTWSTTRSDLGGVPALIFAGILLCAIDKEKEMNKDYYVYKYSENGVTFYVGKGRGGRAYNHIIDESRDHVCIDIIARNLTEEEAFEMEEALLDTIPTLDNKRYPVRYLFTSPSGTVHEIKSLAHFCRKYSLSYNYILDVLSGAKKQYKGWTGHRV